MAINDQKTIPQSTSFKTILWVKKKKNKQVNRSSDNTVLHAVTCTCKRCRHKIRPDQISLCIDAPSPQKQMGRETSVNCRRKKCSDWLAC